MARKQRQTGELARRDVKADRGNGEEHIEADRALENKEHANKFIIGRELFIQLDPER